MHHVDGVLRNGIERGNRFRVGLKGPLRDDQIGEFGGNVDVRGLQRAILHRCQA